LPFIGGTHSKLKNIEQLKLHSFGQNDHLESLKEKYESLKRKIKGNEKLNQDEKSMELKTLTKSLKREIKNSKNNLY
jgi:uncharacterized protein YdcH (DUF465 family)